MIRLTRLLLAAGAATVALSLQAGQASASAGSPAPGSPRVAMIVLDVSKALSNTQTEAERRAALRYAQALPPDVEVGLVKFSAQWQVVLQPTANRGELAGALSASHRSGTTAAAIYDALSAAESAVQQAGGGAGSRLVVLSEGETIPDPTVTLALPADVIPWHSDADDNLAALRAIAAASGGRVAAPADSAALAGAFPSITRATAQRPASAQGGFRWVLTTVLAVVFVTLLYIGLLLTGALRREDPGRRLEAQLDRHYAPRHGYVAADERGGEGKVASATVGWVAQRLGSDTEQRLALRLDLAGIGRKPAEWVVLGCSGGLVFALLLTLLTGSPLVGVPAGALAVWLSMRLIVSTRISRQRAAFAGQLPDVLQLIAGSLQSGFSLPQALDAVVREGTQPTAGEFSRALAETRLGGELEDALERVADRMDSTDLRWSVMAIRIQRSVGGNLVEVLRNTVDMMRERAGLRRHVRALSAEGRLSAYILIALPVLVGAWLFLSRDSYMRPLYTTPLGLVMLVVGAVLMALGTVWMRNVIKVEV